MSQNSQDTNHDKAATGADNTTPQEQATIVNPRADQTVTDTQASNITINIPPGAKFFAVFQYQTNCTQVYFGKDSKGDVAGNVFYGQNATGIYNVSSSDAEDKEG